MKKIFLVTLNYNTAEETHQWLSSMRKLIVPNYDLQFIIIDNASKEPFSLVKNEQGENIHVIRSEVNTGFAGGNNIGMQYALNHGADYILCINNDTFAEKKLLQELVAVLENEPKVGVVTPKIYFAKGHEFHIDRYKKEDLGKVFWYAGGYTDWANVRSVHRGVDEVDQGQYDKQEKIQFASGCCMLFKREVLEKIGLFDERYFLYFEDADLNERVKKKGYDITYIPKAVLWHMNAASSGGSGNLLQDYFLTRNRLLFGMTYAPLRTKIALVRESFSLLLTGRPMQKKGIRDFLLGKFGKGTYFDK